MLNKWNNWFRSFFKKEDSSKITYILVESKFEENSEECFRQGVKITNGKFSGVITTFSPKVKFEERPDGFLLLKFDYTVESNPNCVIIEDIEFREVLGGIIVDLIEKDYKK